MELIVTLHASAKDVTLRREVTIQAARKLKEDLTVSLPLVAALDAGNLDSAV